MRCKQKRQHSVARETPRAAALRKMAQSRSTTQT
jgi:hypothetical protein